MTHRARKKLGWFELKNWSDRKRLILSYPTMTMIRMPVFREMMLTFIFIYCPPLRNFFKENTEPLARRTISPLEDL